jgi:hypothetical protein
MSNKPKYFDPNGNEVDAGIALDRHGALRDGCTLHVPFRARDGLSDMQLAVCDAATRFTDQSGNPWSASRPGFRVRSGDAARQAVKDQAYAEYTTSLCNSYKLHDGQQLCPDCLGSGIADGDTCDGCGGSGVVPNDYESSLDEMVESTAADSRDINIRISEHKQVMSKLYDAYDRSLSEAWRQR